MKGSKVASGVVKFGAFFSVSTMLKIGSIFFLTFGPFPDSVAEYCERKRIVTNSMKLMTLPCFLFRECVPFAS